MRVFSKRSQMMTKCGARKKKKMAQIPKVSVSLMYCLLLYSDLIFDLLLKRLAVFSLQQNTNKNTCLKLYAYVFIQMDH